MAIFQDIQEFRRHAPQMHQQYDWEKLVVDINQVTILRVLPFLSQDFYLHLEESYFPSNLGYTNLWGAYVAGGGQADATAAEEQAIRYLQTAIANFTLIHLLSSNRVQVSEMGVQESSSKDGSSTPATFHAIQDAKDQAAAVAYEYMELLLRYLEANASDFTIWQNSEAYTRMKGIFTWNTELFNLHATIGESRHTYLHLRPFLEQVQRWEIAGELGQTLTNTMIMKLQAGTLTATEQGLLTNLQAWQVNAAMAQALPMLRVQIKGGHIYIRSEMDGPARKTGLNNDILNGGTINNLVAQYMEQRHIARRRTIRYLRDHASAFSYLPSEETFWLDGEITDQLPDNGYNEYGIRRRSFRT